MPDAPGPIWVDFRDVGRDKRAWSRTFPRLDLNAIARAAGKALLSSDIFAVYDTEENTGVIFAGVVPVGAFTVREGE